MDGSGPCTDFISITKKDLNANSVDWKEYHLSWPAPRHSSDPMRAIFTVLGSGTSHGVPQLRCSCPICASPDPRDTRSRASGILECPDGTRILIDCGPDIRTGLLKAGVSDITALLITHGHADHIHGLDDLHSLAKKHGIPVFANAPACVALNDAFYHRFALSSPWRLNRITDSTPIVIEGVTIIPIPMIHGDLEVSGYRIGNFAYLTDANDIPDSSVALLQGVELVVIDALRLPPHSTHFSIPEAVEALARFLPKKAWLTHLSHAHSHFGASDIADACRGEFPELTDCDVQVAYDGLKIEIELGPNETSDVSIVQ
jgi:phosphoribosyl 1,2-cyclic phosphate phosphodiesterase